MQEIVNEKRNKRNVRSLGNSLGHEFGNPRHNPYMVKGKNLNLVLPVSDGGRKTR